MGVDLSGLNLTPVERVDYDKYVPGKESSYRRPPDEGKLTWQTQPDIKFGTTKNGKLMATLQLQVADGPNKGYTTRAWINVEKSKFNEGNSMLDYLRAHGITAKPTNAIRRIL